MRHAHSNTRSLRGGLSGKGLVCLEETSPKALVTKHQVENLMGLKLLFSLRVVGHEYNTRSAAINTLFRRKMHIVMHGFWKGRICILI